MMFVSAPARYVVGTQQDTLERSMDNRLPNNVTEPASEPLGSHRTGFRT